MYRPAARLGVLARPLVVLILVVVVATPNLAALGHSTSTAPRAGASPPDLLVRPAGPVPRELPPAHPPTAPRLTPRATVNPNMLYTGEPAPMGITDFGIDNHGNGYTYSTSAIEGVTYLRNFSVYNANDGLPTVVSIQLNVVLQFSQGGSLYQFWIQDVAFLDTNGNSPTFLNNIWNFSNANQSLYMDSNSVSGNGSVYGNEFYYDGAGGQGNGIVLPKTSEIDLQVVATTVNNQPSVIFEYQDGYGWETYDNVVFPFATGATGTEFIVDGTQYNPYGLFDDAELILGGPGGGTDTNATYANLSLAILTWNGHNFQAVRNAYNFGSDTAEGISGVKTARSGTATNATLSDDVTLGAGTLGMLYGAGYSAVVNVSTNIASGNLFVGGGSPIAYRGGEANVTIAPGNFLYSIYNATGAIAAQNFTVAAGGYTSGTLNEGHVYLVRFTESGLFANPRWSVSLGDVALSTRNRNQSFFFVNGSFDYAVTPVPGFILNASRGTVTVAGADRIIDLTFIVVLYQVQIYETGLPTGTSWSLSVFNQSFPTTGIALSFGLPNGSWQYNLSEVPGWTPYPDGVGTITVTAASQRITINYVQFRLPILFQATGLPHATFWYVEVGTDWTNGSISTLRATEPNGSYHYKIEIGQGWIASPQNGTVYVSGQPVFLNISFVPFTFPVTFNETGLPAGTTWGVEVASIWLNGTGPFQFLLGNGSYDYTISEPMYWLTDVNLTGTVVVAGAAFHETVPFHPPPPQYGSVSGSFSPATATLTVDGTVVNASHGVFMLRLLVGIHTLSVTLTGYRSFTEQVNVTKDSTIVLKAIVLQPVTSTGPGSTQNVSRLPPPGTSATEDALLGLGIAGLVLAGFAVVLGRGRRT